MNLDQESACDGVPVMAQKVFPLVVDVPQAEINWLGLADRPVHESHLWCDVAGSAPLDVGSGRKLPGALSPPTLLPWEEVHPWTSAAAKEEPE
jgi:hypothetical protein